MIISPERVSNRRPSHSSFLGSSLTLVESTESAPTDSHSLSGGGRPAGTGGTSRARSSGTRSKYPLKSRSERIVASSSFVEERLPPAVGGATATETRLPAVPLTTPVIWSPCGEGEGGAF